MIVAIFFRYAIYALAVAALAWNVLHYLNRIHPSWLAGTQGKIGLPNWISICRIIGSLIAVDIYLTQSFGSTSNLLACLIFAIALLTDAIDGKIARSTGQISKAGKYLDPLCDKVIIYSAIVSFIFSDSNYLFGQNQNINLTIATCLGLIVSRDILFFIWFAFEGRKIKQGLGAGLMDKARTIVLSIWLISETLYACIPHYHQAISFIIIISFILAGILSPVTMACDFKRWQNSRSPK